MKIAMIAPTPLPARRANTVQVMKMAQALIAQEHTVLLLASPTAGVPGAEAADLSPQALMHHYGLHLPITVEWLPAIPFLRRYDFSWIAVQRAIRWGAECIYTRLPQAAALSSRLGVPTVLEVHDLPRGRMGPLFLRGFTSGRGARRLVVITRALARDLAVQLGAALEPPFLAVAPDGVDLERYHDLPAPDLARRKLLAAAAAPVGGNPTGASALEPNAILRLRPDGFTAGYTGHLYPGRGADMLPAIARRLPQINFLIAGGEPQDIARLQAQAAGQDNVILTGFIPNADLPLVQAACDALLMPYGEQVAASSGGDIARYLSPMKLFEYLACGRAILSSALPVLEEVLNSENSLLLPPADVDAWVRALQRLLDEPELRQRLAEAARRDAHIYTWESRAARIFAWEV